MLPWGELKQRPEVVDSKLQGLEEESGRQQVRHGGVQRGCRSEANGEPDQERPPEPMRRAPAFYRVRDLHFG